MLRTLALLAVSLGFVNASSLADSVSSDYEIVLP